MSSYLEYFDRLNEYLVAHSASLLRPTDRIYETTVTHAAIYEAFCIVGVKDSSLICRACQRFISRYGSLAVWRDGKLVPVFWCKLDEKDSKEPWYKNYKPVMDAVVDLFAKAKVVSIFQPECTTIGIPTDGGYNHFYFKVPRELLGKLSYTSAEAVELKNMLTRVLADNSKDVITQAHDLLVFDRVSYAEKCKAPIQWLHKLKSELDELKKMDDEKKAPLAPGGPVGMEDIGATETDYAIRLHQAVQDSPTGFIHSARNGMLSIVLNSIAAGDTLETTKSKYIEKANPAAYMRPTAAPAAGTVKEAERLFAEMKLTDKDLARRFALHDDVPVDKYVWQESKQKEENKQKDEKEAKVGIFSHLPVKGRLQQQDISETKITMAKFIKEVLPLTSNIEWYVPGLAPLYAFITGNKDTFPLMQWHTPENLMSWYTYQKPSAPEDFNLKSHSWGQVTSILPFPHMWKDAEKHAKQTPGYLFTIQGCWDKKHTTGACLFPECMKSEFHGVRSVIESYSNRASISGASTAELVGLGLRPHGDGLSNGSQKMRVTTKSGSKLIYVIDRMD